mmetsp:Transcript_177312/g.568511  ORF Transcript_177312/g.568511 Transcript_177312/m.568511 type:complete len:409 (+) Transcript_177312:147-1373(+)
MAAPIVRNPFASAPPPQAAGGGGCSGGCGGGGPGRGYGEANSPTGPMLGKGSELARLWSMPESTGHADGVNCLAMVDDRVYSGGRDGNLFIWRGVQMPGGGFELVQDCPPIALQQSVTSLYYDAAAKWLFCGLWNGEIQAYCKDPVVEDRLQGHRRSVSGITVHSGVVVSGSNDGTIRLWTRPTPQSRWQCHGQPLNNPSGAVTAVKVLGDALWVAAQNGITCFDLNTLQPKGTIPSNHQTTALVECQGFMLATFRNGDIKIFDATGNQTFLLPSRGEHTSNMTVELMMHPLENKPMILCGQQYGYVTAYDLPDFRPRGSWVCKQNSDNKAILDVKFGGLFITAGVHGDITVWQWGAQSSGPPGAAPTATSPFAPAGGGCAGQQAPSPFGGGGVGGFNGGCAGGGMAF